jgi:hypothetical protein
MKRCGLLSNVSILVCSTVRPKLIRSSSVIEADPTPAPSDSVSSSEAELLGVEARRRCRTRAQAVDVKYGSV